MNFLEELLAIFFFIFSNTLFFCSETKILELLKQDKRVALTEHHSANTVFSFGRDQGQYGRILNQTVIVEDSINVKNGNEVTGFCLLLKMGILFYQALLLL